MSSSDKSAETKPKARQISTIQAVRVVLAGYILLILLAQLFTFDKFPALLQDIGLGVSVSIVLAILLVVSELLAIPFLINMTIPAWLSRLSFYSLFVAMTSLTILEVLAFTVEQTVFLGATFYLPSGSWSLLLLLAIWLLVAWSSLEKFGKIDNKPSR